VNDLRSYNRTALIGGLIFVVIGVVFLLEQLDVYELRAVYVWPVVLIAVGVAVLLGGLSSLRGRDQG
jgi:ABC-type antimicrobial peptide transport system permease subunit